MTAVPPGLPARVVFLPGVDRLGRRGALRRLAADCLGRSDEEVAVRHEDGAPPRLVAPAGATLFLSSASRNGFAALAAAIVPVGIDVEVALPMPPPWNVLHPEEAARLRLAGERRAERDFARLWSVKEAYLKAIGTGLRRDPREVTVAFADAQRARVRDGADGSEAISWWPADDVVVSLVTLVTAAAPRPARKPDNG